MTNALLFLAVAVNPSAVGVILGCRIERAKRLIADLIAADGRAAAIDDEAENGYTL